MAYISLLKFGFATIDYIIVYDSYLNRLHAQAHAERDVHFCLTSIP